MGMKVVFENEPSLSPFGEADEWVLNAPFLVRVLDHERAGLITIPAGFITDLASVPKWLPLSRSFLAGNARRAAIAHDYLYVSQAGKEFADDVFLAAMNAEKVNTAVRWLFYAAVHHFGNAIYDGKESNEAAPADAGE